MADPLSPPVVLSTTSNFADVAELERALAGDGYLYARWGNPGVQALESRLAGLLGAEQALAFASGMAAISHTLIAALQERPRLLCPDAIYGGTHQLARDLLPRLGAQVQFFPLAAWEETLAASEPAVLVVETPTNPTLRMLDLAALAQAARAGGHCLVVDNTFATPVVQRPLELGAHVEVHSASKYLGGHHDLLAGVVGGDAEFIAALDGIRKLLGGILDPWPAFLLHRGLKTLDVRVTRQSASAQRLAEWLAARPEVERVHYPGLPTHPEHALVGRQMRSGGGMLAFELAGGFSAARRFADGLQAVLRAPSLGGTESQITLPPLSSHASLSPAERAAAGIAEGLVRFSVGLEAPERLEADLEQALSRL